MTPSQEIAGRAEAWCLPPTPLLVVRAARAGHALMLLLALAWCTSLVVDALHGRTSWGASVAGVGLGLGWLAWAVRRQRVPHTVGQRLHWVEPEALIESDATEGWHDEAGEPVALRVVFDLGPVVLLRLVHSGSCPASFHWVDADLLTGPWRWRMMMASSLTLPSRETALSNSPQRSAGSPA